MRDLFNPTLWTKRWQAATLGCESQACAEMKSAWHRMRARRHGTLLEGVFYCQQCLELALRGHLSRLHAALAATHASNRIPLGLLLVARGRMTYNEVLAALEAQRRARYGRIGDWFEKLGFATIEEITAALGLQWGCPVASSLDSGAIDPAYQVPLDLLEAFHMLPLNYAPSLNTLYLAIGERVHHATLYAIEKMLGCRAQQCVAWRKHIVPRLEGMRQKPPSHEVVFNRVRDAAEMARISASYIAKTCSEEVRLCRVGPFIWLRLKCRPNQVDLLFRVGNETHRPQRLPQPFFPLPPSRLGNRGGARAAT